MKMVDLANAALGRWPGILGTLGAAPEHLKKLHGPCPFCGGKDRYRFIDDGMGKWFCNQCGHGDGFDWLQRKNGWTLKQAKEEVIAVLAVVPASAPVQERDPEHKATYMRKVWAESRPVAPGDPVWCYLSRRCGDPTGYLGDIRYHPALRHSVSGTDHPAMVARMRAPDGKKAIGLHRTYLTPDGRKADVDPVRMSFGDIGAVRLGPFAERMGIAEGVETAICASKAFGIPVWSAICANGLASWEPPPNIQTVVIFGDNDASTLYDGQIAAFTLAKRMRMLHLEVEVRIPDKNGQDWADVNMPGAV